MKRIVCKECVFTIKKAFSIGLCSFIFCNTFFTDSSFAQSDEAKAVIEKTQNLFTPLLQLSDEKIHVQETIATVNDEPITLGDLFAVYGAGTFVTSISLPQLITSLCDDFSIVLQELITDELVRQDLVKHGIFVTDMDFQRAEQEARVPFIMQDELERAKRRQVVEATYTQGAEKQKYLKDIEKIDTFSESLLERGLNLTEWRTMLARQVRKTIFMEQVLEPTIHLTPDAIEAAYRTHPELAHVEKRVQYRLFSVSSPDTATRLLDAFTSGADEQMAGISGYVVEDFLMPYTRLPAALERVVQRAEKKFVIGDENFHYAEIIKENNSPEVIVVQKILPERVLTLGEAYVRLEQALMEQARAEAFSQWLEQAWQGAHIRLNPQLSLCNSYHDESEDVQKRAEQ